MTSKQESERQDSETMQREKERERRRLRDRQRRQNMSQEQRDKHLARRRRNYQLRRLRAQNAKLLHSNQTHAKPNTNATHLIINHPSVSFPSLDYLPTTSETHQGGEAKKLQKTSTRLRVSDIRHLARRLHSDGQHQNDGVQTSYVASYKILRLTHVKRLARAVKLAVN